MEVKAKAKRSFTRQVFKAKHAVLNAVTRDTPTLTHRDFTIDDWGRKIHHQQEESKGKRKKAREKFTLKELNHVSFIVILRA